MNPFRKKANLQSAPTPEKAAMRLCQKQSVVQRQLTIRMLVMYSFLQIAGKDINSKQIVFRVLYFYTQ